jgi:hypothetical protein
MQTDKKFVGKSRLYRLGYRVGAVVAVGAIAVAFLLAVYVIGAIVKWGY